MIKEALTYIADDLDTFLKRKYVTSERSVKLGSILNQDGSVPEENRNKIIISVINLEHESTIPNAIHGKQFKNHFDQVNPPLCFNVNVMVAALFNNYEESLKFISGALYYFQAKSHFDGQNSPGLDPEIFQLSAEVMKLNSTESFNLWSSMGTKYIPSVPFKIRMITFQGDQTERNIPNVAAVKEHVQADV